MRTLLRGVVASKGLKGSR
uniref:Uncharacterized protein n=1 Tax=Arundo donax TaxID=35708 RepID=A0A0A9G718_ARUDO